MNACFSRRLVTCFLYVPYHLTMSSPLLMIETRSVELDFAVVCILPFSTSDSLADNSDAKMSGIQVILISIFINHAYSNMT